MRSLNSRFDAGRSIGSSHGINTSSISQYSSVILGFSEDLISRADGQLSKSDAMLFATCCWKYLLFRWDHQKSNFKSSNFKVVKLFRLIHHSSIKLDFSNKTLISWIVAFSWLSNMDTIWWRTSGDNLCFVPLNFWLEFDISSIDLQLYIAWFWSYWAKMARYNNFCFIQLQICESSPSPRFPRQRLLPCSQKKRIATTSLIAVLWKSLSTFLCQYSLYSK